MRQHQMEVVQVQVDKVQQHPDNANNGDLEAIAESIEVNGLFTPIMVQRSTGNILIGNHRYIAALSLGARNVPVVYLDVDDTEAKRIMVADNRTARLGHDDEAQLANILEDLYATDSGLAGTGYEFEDYTKLLAGLNEPLSFPDPVVDIPDNGKNGASSALHFTIAPIVDPDGVCTEISICKEGMGPISRNDFQAIRKAFGLGPADQNEIEAWGVPAWTKR